MGADFERDARQSSQASQLTELWRRLESDPSYAHAVVIVPSLSFDPKELAKISGVAFYEERLLFLLMRLRNPAARVLYLTSQPLPQEIVDYYLDLLVGVPASHARARLATMCVYDARPVPLTQKILERPRLVSRIRTWIGNPKRACMTCFNSSALEGSLAEELRIPLNGVDPSLVELGTKSGSRKVFREAGIALPDGFEDVRSREEVIDCLQDLERRDPCPKKAVVKLNDSFAGEGNAVFTFPAERGSRTHVEESLATLQWNSASERSDSFFSKLQAQGGIVERFVEADEVRSPSVQMRITPTGEIQYLSTHDQVLGGAMGQAYVGCSFPALAEYRPLLRRDGLKVAEVLRSKGVVSRFGVDFIAWRRRSDPTWRIEAIEVNLRLGGTTFPFVALEFLTDGQLDSDGEFVSARGNRKYYVATDALASPSYRGLLPVDLMELTIEERLIFDPRTETGVLFHMIGAISQYGKLGLIAIGDSPEEAQDHFDQTKRVLDGETGLRRAAEGGKAAPLSRAVQRID